MKNGDWQLHRTMSAREFKSICKNELKISRAAAGRYVGTSVRTIRRVTRGQAQLPASAVLLLRSLVAHGEQPVVPKWERE